MKRLQPESRQLPAIWVPPQTQLEYDGENIAVQMLEEIGGETFDTALYIEKKCPHWYGRFFIWRCDSLPLPAEGESLTMPSDREKYARLTKPRVSVRRVDAKGALNWFVEEFANEGPLKTILLDIVADYVADRERLGKARLVAWIDPHTRKAFADSARGDKKTESDQLELFVNEALAVREVKAARRAKRSSKGKYQPLPGQQMEQLQLVTGLVQYVRVHAIHRKTPAAHAARREVLSALSTAKDARKSAAA